MKRDVHAYHLPLGRPYAWAHGVQNTRHGLLATLRDGGHVGWGEMAMPPHLPWNDAWLEAAQTWRREPESAVRFRLPAMAEGAQCTLAASKAGQDLGTYLAKATGQNAAGTIRVNALVDAAGDAVEQAVAAVAAGYQTLKIKSDGNEARDLVVLQAVQDAVGRMPMRLDPNGAWHPGGVLAHLDALATFNLQYVEQPVAPEHMGLLRQAMVGPVPIALDESAMRWSLIEPFVEAGCRPWIIIKPQRVGGPLQAARLLQHARKAGLPVVVTNSLETAVGRAQALAVASLLGDDGPACGLATGHYFARDVADLGDAPVMKRCTAPGLGVEVNL